jgi:UDP-glucose 4-epimerase
MTTLITGAGIVGSQIAKQLVDIGQTPILLDLKPMPSHIGSVVPLKNVQLIQADVCDLQALRKICLAKGVQNIIHTAAMLTGPANDNPRAAVEVNIGGSINCLELARENTVSKVVLAGSTTVTYSTFGIPRGALISEDFELHAVSEAPKSFYSATKLAMEMLAGLYHSKHGVNCVVVRYGAVLGAWSGPNVGMIAAMVSNLLGAAAENRVAVIDDVRFIWAGVEEFVDARDCASGTLAALHASTHSQRVYTISNNKGWTMPAFLDVVKQVCPRLRIDQRHAATAGIGGFPFPRQAVSDLSAAQKDLNWSPKYSLGESLAYFAEIAGLGGSRTA